MINATATTSTVASRWRRKARPADFSGLFRGGSRLGGSLGLPVLRSTASLTLLIRSLRLSYAVPASEDGARKGHARPRDSSLTPRPGPAVDAGRAPDGRQPSPVDGKGPPAVGVEHQVLVVACAFWMAPAGRLMYSCLVVWPWNRLGPWEVPRVLLV